MTYATVLAGLHERLATVTGTVATLTVNPAGFNDSLLWTAQAAEFVGNSISVEYTDPGGLNKPLTLTLTGRRIIISLATGAGGAITTIASDITAAILAHPLASTMVTAVARAGDGSGVVTAMARAYLSGGISSIVAILDYAPTAIHDTPMIWTLLDSVEINKSGQVTTNRYRILHRLVVRWQDNEQAEQEIIPYVNSIPLAVAADPHLGGRIVSGYAEIGECQAGWITVAGVEYRNLDFYATVIEK